MSRLGNCLVPAQEIPPLQRVFLAFANYGKGSADLLYDMDSKAFAKVCAALPKNAQTHEHAPGKIHPRHARVSWWLMRVGGARVTQLAKDCSLVTKQCTPTDVDLFFTKVIPSPLFYCIGLPSFSICCCACLPPGQHASVVWPRCRAGWAAATGWARVTGPCGAWNGAGEGKGGATH